MAQLPTSVTINDGSTTPVAITFTPISSDSGTVVFADKRKSAKAFWPKMTVSFDGEKPSRRTDHVLYEWEYPMTKVVDGVEVVYDTARFTRGRFVLPSGMPESDRNHFRAFVANGLDVPQVRNMVEDLDPMFG